MSLEFIRKYGVDPSDPILPRNLEWIIETFSKLKDSRNAFDGTVMLRRKSARALIQEIIKNLGLGNCTQSEGKIQCTLLEAKKIAIAAKEILHDLEKIIKVKGEKFE